MELAKFIQIGLPVALALIMFNMGLLLRVEDFRRVLQFPKAFVTGLSAQLLLVPIIALILLQIFHLPPALAIGLLVLSFSPGGTTSNLFSYLAKGNVALSVSLTAVTSLITPFTIPLLTGLALQMQLGGNHDISIPIGLTMMRLLVVTLVPVTLGMMIKCWRPTLTLRLQPIVHSLSILLFMVVIISIVAQQWDKMPEFLNQVGAVTLFMILLAMLTGYVVAKAVNLDAAQVKTISIEIGMQNGGMALVVTQGVLHNSEMSIVPVIYGLMMLLPVLFVVGVSRLRTIAPATLR